MATPIGSKAVYFLDEFGCPDVKIYHPHPRDSSPDACCEFVTNEGIGSPKNERVCRHETLIEASIRHKSSADNCPSFDLTSIVHNPLDLICSNQNTCPVDLDFYLRTSGGNDDACHSGLLMIGKGLECHSIVALLRMPKAHKLSLIYHTPPDNSSKIPKMWQMKRKTDHCQRNCLSWKGVRSGVPVPSFSGQNRSSPLR